MKDQAGQVVLILLLVMTVGLAIGLSVIQRSLKDVGTASKTEQSSRAFFAAEAGIERALKGSCTIGDCVSSFQNNAKATTIDIGSVPVAVGNGTQQVALEYPAISKETFAQFWIADPNLAGNPVSPQYSQATIDFYWGIYPADTNPSNLPALEVTEIYYSAGSYVNKKYFYDPNSTRISTNGFNNSSIFSYSAATHIIATTTGPTQTFAYKVNLPLQLNTILIRTRFLYSSAKHPLAMRAVGTCGASCNIPSQARIILSSGVSGTSQRNIQFFSLDKVVPTYLDFAIFSAGAISK